MVRIHVVRASHLAMAAAIVLAAILAVFAIVTMKDESRAQSGADTYSVWEAEAQAVSASALFAPLEEAEKALPEAEKKQCRVLIYHTHTHEAYMKKETDEYVETALWRTDNNRYNIVRVGEVLAELLTERGFSVRHDTTDHELTDLSTAYTRSVKTMEKYKDETDVYIDLHRDAYHKDASGNPFSITFEDRDMARIMFLVGNGKGFSDPMYYTENYALATLLTGTINEAVPGLCRPVMIKDGRYNQHLCDQSMLIEVGHNQNTIEQAINAMPVLADALKSVLLE